MNQKLFDYYVINLDRSTERWERINTHLIGGGVIAQRISAVYAADLPADEIGKVYTSQLNKQQFFMPLKSAEIGCFMSHIKALKHFLEHSEKPFAVILEDDVEFIRPVEDLQPQWLAAVNTEHPVMLKLYARRPVDGKVSFKSGIDSSVCSRLVPLGTQAAVVNRAAAQKLVATFKQFGMPVDVAYQHWWQCCVKVLVTVPNHINEISEEVGGSNISQKTKLSFSYKIQRELKRSWYRLALSIKSRFNYWRVY